MASPIVLILDKDLGFILALSQELTSRKISAFPARAPGEARSILRQLRLRPDVLVINCGVANACSFANEVARMRPELRVIGIVSDANGCNDCADAPKAQLHDREDREPSRIPYCVDIIEAFVQGRQHGRVGAKSTAKLATYLR